MSLFNCLSCLRQYRTKTQSLELHIAIWEGDFALLKQLVDDDDFDINYDAGYYYETVYYYGTPLLQAAIHGTTECFIYLLQNGASLDNFDSRETKEDSILHVAAKHGSLEIVRYLVEECGMKANNDLRTPMDVTCSYGQFKVLRYLVERQGYHQSLTLHFAACEGNFDILEYCIEQGANMEVLGKVECSGSTPLHCVVSGSHSDERVVATRALLRHGANPLALTTEGCTTMHNVRSFAVASHLVERDYWLAREGGQFDPTVAHKLLCTRDNSGQDSLAAIQEELVLMDCTDALVVKGRDFSLQGRSEMNKLGVYVGGWTCSRSFIPDDGQLGHNLSVVPNPRLGDFQRFLVCSVYQHLEQTAICEVACVVMGYLAPVDLLNGWEQWKLTADELLQ